MQLMPGSMADRGPGPCGGVSDRWHPSALSEDYDRWARRWLEDRADQGRRVVDNQLEHVRLRADAGRTLRSAPNGSDSSVATQLIRVLRRIILKPMVPRFTSSTLAARDDNIRQWSEYTQQSSAVDGGIMMRCFVTENTLATVCYLCNFPTPHVQSISDADRL